MKTIENWLYYLVILITLHLPQKVFAGWTLEVQLPKLSGEVDLPKYVEGVYRFAAMAVGIVGVLMFMVGGFQYMISVGQKGRAEEAKKTMINAIIGIIMVIAATVFLRTINTELTNLQELEFN